MQHSWRSHKHINCWKIETWSPITPYSHPQVVSWVDPAACSSRWGAGRRSWRRTRSQHDGRRGSLRSVIGAAGRRWWWWWPPSKHYRVLHAPEPPASYLETGLFGGLDPSEKKQSMVTELLMPESIPTWIQISTLRKLPQPQKCYSCVMLGSEDLNSAWFLHDFVLADKFSVSARNTNIVNDEQALQYDKQRVWHLGRPMTPRLKVSHVK